MKKAILCVSFGTSVAAARESISAVEAALEVLAPDRLFCRAFTSPTIRRILEKRGERVLSVEEALASLEKADCTEVFIQPTHLLYGIEYEKIQAITQRWAGRFVSLRLGRPLLADEADIAGMTDALRAAYPVRSDEALILLGHGTDHPANAAYSALQAAFAAAGRTDVLIGTVEGVPDFDGVSTALKRSGMNAVHLVPLMLVAGDHAQNDMAGPGPESWKTRLEGEGYAVRCTMQGLGLLSAVREMYCKRASKYL